MPNSPLLLRLAAVYRGHAIHHPHLKAVTLAQWMLESGRGTSSLATEHLNFGGLKFRPEMAGHATKVRHEAHDGVDDYCKFASLEAFIDGYWRFINRPPYSGWEQHADSAEEYIRFIGPIYTPSTGYADKVLGLVREAQELLVGAAEAQLVAEPLGRHLGTVVLDPGHGGHTKVGGSSPNNAISVSGVKEKTLALDFCLLLRDLLVEQARADGDTIKVVLTRTSDVNIGIAERAAVAGAHKADCFICLHFNGFHKPEASGAETFFAAKVNGNLNEAEDKAFAEAVHAGLLAGMRSVMPGAKDRRVKPDTESGPKVMGVLRDTSLGNAGRTKKCVACYIEAEFITNPEVDRVLISGPAAIANRTKVLAHVAGAVRGYLAKARPDVITAVATPVG